MRILITGSREWKDQNKIIEEVRKAHVNNNDKVTIVHGHCPKGADLLTDLAFVAWPNIYELERYPANWKRDGKGAGPIRNQKMVNLGADICLAFITPNSKGTKDCIERAWKAGIPVRIFPEIE